MSRAFVKGDDSDLPEQNLPERALGNPPFYVTPRGLDGLRQRQFALAGEHAALKLRDEYLERPRLLEIERDLRYLRARLEGAVVVDNTAQPRNEVHFGATVTTRDESGVLRDFALVGEDEANAAQGLISWRSPLAALLIGASVGDTVRWQRPAGATDLEIVAICYR